MVLQAEEVGYATTPRAKVVCFRGTAHGPVSPDPRFHGELAAARNQKGSWNHQ